MQTITLKDGTTLQGKLIGVQGDEHIFQTESLGQIRVKYNQIANISYSGASSTNASVTLEPFGGSQDPMTQQAQKMLMSDPEIMNAMTEIANDPELSDLLQNPALLMKMQTMSPEEMQNDPDMKRLLDNPKMQFILQKAAQKFQGSAP